MKHLEVRGAVWFAAGAALFVAGLRVGGAAENPPADRVHELLKERATLRKQAADMMRKLAANPGGGVSAMEVIEANIVALRAEFDAAETKAERVAILQSIVTAERDREQRLARDMGMSALDRIEARVRRLDAEIALERAKQSETGKVG